MPVPICVNPRPKSLERSPLRSSSSSESACWEVRASVTILRGPGEEQRRQQKRRGSARKRDHEGSIPVAGCRPKIPGHVDIFFDLDGTLTDPGIGITRCIQHALVSLGRPAPDLELLRPCVGPPLHSSFAELLETQDPPMIAEAIRLYRERYAPVGMFENRVYEDVPAGLETLLQAGHRLWVVTSKPHVFARQIVEHFGIAGYFESVYGSELSGENVDKADLIRHVLEQESLAPEHVWMIGDRRHDIEGARQNGVDAIGVLWGYGSREELLAAGPRRVVGSMTELCEAVESRSLHLSGLPIRPGVQRSEC